MKDKINSIFTTLNQIKFNREIINKHKEDNDNLLNELKKLSNDENIKKVIIDNLHVDDNGEPLFLQSSYRTSSSNGKTEEQKYSYPNTNASFRPSEDEFEISDIEFDDEGISYRVKVECIRRRRFINPFMWEPDFYWTDWIKF